MVRGMYIFVPSVGRWLENEHSFALDVGVRGGCTKSVRDTPPTGVQRAGKVDQEEEPQVQ